MHDAIKSLVLEIAELRKRVSDLEEFNENLDEKIRLILVNNGLIPPAAEDE